MYRSNTNKLLAFLLGIFILCGCATPDFVTPTPLPTPTQAEREALRTELIAMLQEDQAVLDARSITVEEFNDISARHVQQLEEMIDRFGWPTISMVGAEASGSAFIIVQHADGDLEFQKRTLALIEPLAARGEIFPANYAYLYDRIARNENRPQRFGTQGRCMDDGSWEPFPLEEPKRLEELRAEYGLEPFEEYKEAVAELCN